MEKKVFSIIIPIYNAERHLKSCLDSIVNQNYLNYEVLLIDDGSTDKSGEICDDYVSRFKKFKVIHKENKGVSNARNKGIELSQGEYLLFVDSDDFLSETYLSSIYSVIEKSNPSVVVNSSYYIYSQNSYFCETYAISNISEITSENITDLLLERVYPSALWMSVYKRSLLDNHRLDETIHFYEDLDFQLSLVDSLKCISINKIPGYFYRDGSETHSTFSEKTISCYKLIDKLYKKNISISKINILESEFVISNAIIAAKDIKNHKSLDKILKIRAKKLKKSISVKNKKNIYKWIKLIALSPKLFYVLFRIKHRKE
ncbi:glycosyltransferase [Faecalibacillus intestinalis]|uniref:Glycosyltransferase n=1 Tax=Faecalibacillus intestinalis TaxID=1982626 RepID=A0AAP2UKE9_9FIRM|nr:glycosyltransferase [Faecalibacillus intestinalis]RGI22769.1 glycosyltransferase [Coprobacillus sp. OM08-19]MCB8593367.1 glycosyltransferase [Faecalibacillus intestinalis]MCB8614445.1 glycosyltransferase [Faecalibacillus intestinalis]MCG4681975.1 glycosyltransferase [Faecalibacillus intestinalis]MCG4714786.1 glycosyltransferase [Faecalibacillus intestinalis]